MFQFGSYFNFESICSSISDVCLRTCLIEFEFEFEFELNCEFEFALVDSFTKTFLITLLLLILDQKGDFSLPHCTMRTANRRLQGSKRFQLYY